MAAIVLAVVAGICALGWLTNKISVWALSYYMAAHNINISDQEMKESVNAVIKHWLRLDRNEP